MQMPKDQKALTQILAQLKKSDTANLIHGVIFLIQEDLFRNLALAEISKIKDTLQKITLRGREPIIVITKIDNKDNEFERCVKEERPFDFESGNGIIDLKQMAEGSLELPIENIKCAVTYNSPKLHQLKKRIIANWNHYCIHNVDISMFDNYCLIYFHHVVKSYNS
jgi:50S ribosomal subunit-associated GTPase HflX